MTGTLSKGVLRSITVMFLFVGLLGMWMGGCQTQELKVERLIKALQDQEWEVRASAALALGNIGGGAGDAVPALIKALQDQDEWVRSRAAVALGRIGSKDVVPVLIQALNDQSVSVRGNAAKVLDSIGTIYPEALEAVKEYRFRQ